MFGSGWSRLALPILSATLGCNRVAAVDPQAEVALANAPAVVVETPPVARTCVARTPPGAPLLIPDMAEWMVHIGPRAVLRSSTFGLVAPALEQEPDWAKAVATARECGVSFEQIDHVLIGFNAAEDFAAIVVAPGIARPEVARCVIMQIQIASSETPAADVQPLPGDEGVSMIQFTDGRAYLFGADMLVLATTAWQDAILELSSCRGAPAAYASLARPLRGLDLDAPLWVAAAPSAQTLATLGASTGLDMTGISSFGASVRLDDGTALMTRVQMHDAATAGSLAQVLQSFVQMGTSFLPPELSAVPSRVVVETVGSELVFDASMRLEELRFLASQNP